jgi:hypothetical protein
MPHLADGCCHPLTITSPDDNGIGRTVAYGPSVAHTKSGKREIRDYAVRVRLRAILCVAGSVAALFFARPVATVAAQALEDIPGVPQMHWLTGVRTLPNSGGILNTPTNAKLLVGPDVPKLEKVLESFDPTTEGELRFTRLGTVEYQFCNCGYIIADDWSCVNADEVIASIQRYYENQGWDEVVGFTRPPHYDRAHATITYLIHFRNDTRHDFYEGDALIFGRDGFETLIAGTRKGDAAGTWAQLQTAMAAFRFPAGRTYADYKPGDTSSANHIATAFAEKVGADDLVEHYFSSCATQRT